MSSCVPLSTGKMDFSLTPPLEKNLHLAKDKRTKDKTDHVTDFRSSAGYGLIFFKGSEFRPDHAAWHPRGIIGNFRSSGGMDLYFSRQGKSRDRGTASHRFHMEL